MSYQDILILVSNSGESLACVRIKSLTGDFHIGFSNKKLGESFIIAKGLLKSHNLISIAELTSSTRFDFAGGLLFIDSELALTQLLSNPEHFHYSSHMLQISIPIVSDNPW